MKPKISVIVPVYKVEKYLDECVSSICAQTLKDIEIILVDDGSPDSSGAMCEKWAQKDKRIIVFHKSNGGLSDARNYGIEHSTGEYLAFVDSDDKIQSDFCESLYNACCTEKTKVAIGLLALWTPEDNKQTPINDFESFLTPQKMNFQLFSGMYHNPACRKLYHRSIFDNPVNRFPFGLLHEDIGFWWQIMAQIDKVSVVNKVLYLYRQNNMECISKGKNLIRRRSDSVFSFSYGLKNAYPFLNEEKKVPFVLAFLEKFLLWNSDKEITSKARKEYFNVLRICQPVILGTENYKLKKLFLNQVYIPSETALLSFSFFNHKKDILISLFLRIFGIKIIEIIIKK